MAFNLREALGATETYSVQRFTIYLPDKDRNNQPVPDIQDYVEAAMTLLMEINNGVTRLPVAEGMFVDRSTNIVSREATHLVYSFLVRPDEFVRRIEDVNGFLHLFGRRTNQASVVVELAGEEVDEGGAATPGSYFSRFYSIEFPPEDVTLPEAD